MLFNNLQGFDFSCKEWADRELERIHLTLFSNQLLKSVVLRRQIQIINSQRSNNGYENKMY